MGWVFFFAKEIIKLKRGKGNESVLGCFSGRVRDQTQVLKPCAVLSIQAELHQVLEFSVGSKNRQHTCQHWEEASTKHGRKEERASCY